jgi:hypothetical protein
MLLEAHPESLAVCDMEGQTPLATAISCGAPDKEVLFLLESYPQAASQPDSSGKLPLHKAAGKLFSPRQVQALLEAHPAALAALTEGNLSALHLACSSDEWSPQVCVFVVVCPVLAAEQFV